jgi:hypothetical protein
MKHNAKCHKELWHQYDLLLVTKWCFLEVLVKLFEKESNWCFFTFNETQWHTMSNVIKLSIIMMRVMAAMWSCTSNLVMIVKSFCETFWIPAPKRNFIGCFTFNETQWQTTLNLIKLGVIIMRVIVPIWSLTSNQILIVRSS